MPITPSPKKRKKRKKGKYGSACNPFIFIFCWCGMTKKIPDENALLVSIVLLLAIEWCCISDFESAKMRNFVI